MNTFILKVFYEIYLLVQEVTRNLLIVSELLISNIAASLISISPILKYRSSVFDKRPWLDWVTKMSEWTQHHVSIPPDIYWVLKTSYGTLCQSCGIWHSVFTRPHRFKSERRGCWTDQKWRDFKLRSERKILIEQVWKFCNPSRIAEIALIDRKLLPKITDSGRKFVQYSAPW